MAGITIDTTAEDDAFDVTNPQGFDLRIDGCGLSLTVTHEQARSIYVAIRPFFEDDDNAQ